MALRQAGHWAAEMAQAMVDWKGWMDYWSVLRWVPMDVWWVVQWEMLAQKMVDD